MRFAASVLALALVSASFPSEASAQFRARTAPLPSAPAEISVLPSVQTAAPGFVPSLSAPSLSPTPSLSAPSIAPAVSVPAALAVSIVPAAAKPLAVSPVKPEAPLSALSQAAIRLAAAAKPDLSPVSGKAALDQVFSGAAAKDPSDDPSVAGKPSAPEPALAPSAPSNPAPKKEPLVARWKAAMTGGAAPLVYAAFAWNFLAIAAYSIIGPARGALLMTKFGPDTLPWVYMASAALTGLVVAVYNRFTGAPRKYLIGGSLGMLAATLVGGALLVKAAAMPAVSFGYFLWTDVFGIMSTTLFWTYANDVFTHDESKRTFGLIAAGAPLGSIAGALLMKLMVGSMGPVPMLLVAAGIFSLVLPIFIFMERRSKNRGAQPAPKPEKGSAPAHAGILKTIMGSKFLIFLTAIVALERLVPDITNYLYSAAVSAAYAGNAKGMAQAFADVNFWTSIVSFATSSLLVGLTLRKMGTGASLMTAGLANLLLFLIFPFSPTFGIAALFFGLDGVTRYTWFKTAKESTYAATDRDVIYRVKAFVEMFVYRFARGLAGLLLLGVAALHGGLTGAAVLGIPLALLWLYSSWRLGREHKKLEDANKAAGKE